MKLNDNTILVAGGTSGIGRALAEQLYLGGNRVIIVDEVRESPWAERAGLYDTLFAKRNAGAA